MQIVNIKIIYCTCNLKHVTLSFGYIKASTFFPDSCQSKLNLSPMGLSTEEWDKERIACECQEALKALYKGLSSLISDNNVILADLACLNLIPLYMLSCLKTIFR